LKFRELTGLLSDAEAERWEDIKRTYQQNVKLKGFSSDDKTGQVIATLGNLSDGLDAIRKAMTAGVTQLTDQQDEAQTGSGEEPDAADNEFLADLISQEVSGLKSGLAEINASLSAAVQWGRESFSAPPADIDERKTSNKASDLASSEPHKITVVNKIPPTVVGVLKQQFKLMNAWMQPIHSATQDQRSDTRKLAAQLDECMSLYRELIERIESRRD
jgi:uncharacterized phage infection (PIP) family protein YhgE